MPKPENQERALDIFSPWRDKERERARVTGKEGKRVRMMCEREN